MQNEVFNKKIEFIIYLSLSHTLRGKEIHSLVWHSPTFQIGRFWMDQRIAHVGILQLERITHTWKLFYFLDQDLAMIHIITFKLM